LNMECGNLFPLSSAASCRNRPIKTPPEMNQMYSLHLQKLTQNVDAMKKPWELLKKRNYLSPGKQFPGFVF